MRTPSDTDDIGRLRVGRDDEAFETSSEHVAIWARALEAWRKFWLKELLHVYSVTNQVQS